MLSFFEYELFFWSRFLHRTTAMCCRNVFRMFLCIFNFWPKLTIVASLCLVAIFGNFQNALIFRILAVFWSRFLHRTTAMCCINVLACFYAFLIFIPKWRFWQLYSLCFVTILSNFQNALIFRILAVFWSPFCIEQLQCGVETFLACFYAFLIFDPNWRFWQVYSLCLVAILGNFCSHFSNISCVLEPFFA